MSERPTLPEAFPVAPELVAKPIMQMSLPEYEAWCREYIDRDDKDRDIEFVVFVEKRQWEMGTQGEI